MKKVKILPFLFTGALLSLLMLCVFGLSGCFNIQSDKIPTMDPDYKFEVGKYDVTFDISSNGSMEVCEELTINYQGRYSTGFIRDIPVNGGAQVRNVNVKKINSTGKPVSVWYDVKVDDVNFMSVDIGDSTRKYGKSETYRLTYTYVISNSVLNRGLLPLNPVGTGWGCDLYDVSVKLILPDGYKSAKCYSGSKGSTATYDFSENVADGRTVLTTYADVLSPGHGISFDINFENGKIRSFFDFTPYVFAIIVGILLVATVLIRIFIVGKNSILPVVNYSAPDDMDPMKMGKLIDNRVNGEDVTAMIFYWAHKGYVKINLDNKHNPVIIKGDKNLPEDAPDYERTLYNGLFSYGDAVRSSTLEGSFYRTVRAATSQLNEKTCGLYKKSSLFGAAVFAIISALILGFAPLLLGLFQVSMTLLYIIPLAFGIFPPIIIYSLSSWLTYNKLKIKKPIFAVMTGVICLIILAFTGVYSLFVCPGVINIAAKLVLCALCYTAVACSPLLFNRTKEYTRQLNDIIGFKNFINLAEKQQLETMLEEDPQFYYHILPYAQVLGVSDKWQEKFASITVEPPDWMTGRMCNSFIEFAVINSIIRSSMGSMSANMISRPASSGSNGSGGFGGFGGSFGGSSGGGFGGGGGRGR